MRIAMVLTALALVLIPLTARGHGDAEWIRQNSRLTWCCSPGEDCWAVPSRVTFGEDGYYHVQGLTGRKRQGDMGFYRIPELTQPWACQTPGTNELRCLIMPGAGG